ncbi:MAG: 5-bromo-4-chloroindolyl phosphate hydrolysis family protein [Streptococcaceae bacterium]|jgi:5-bromo-4-chloroindolyl phosphate hydrolysis protein|nr:5-bromo-4-chloroindolyl phosphate hydrolysis family protein [Streptococcaceae bacterium]
MMMTSDFSVWRVILTVLVALFILKIMGGFGWIWHGRRSEKRALREKELLRAEIYHEAGFSEKDIEIFTREMNAAKKQIDSWIARVKNSNELQMIEQVTAGLDSAKNIFRELQKNPKNLTKQNAFLYTDLPNMLALTEKYESMQLEKMKNEVTSRDLSETLLLIKTLSKKIATRYHDMLMDDVNIIKGQIY